MKYNLKNNIGEAKEYWPTIVKKLINYLLQKPPATWMTEKTNAKKLP